MARPVKVTLMGRSFTLQTDEDEAHVQRVALLVDGRLTDLQARARLPVESLALLAPVGMKEYFTRTSLSLGASLRWWPWERAHRDGPGFWSIVKGIRPVTEMNIGYSREISKAEVRASVPIVGDVLHIKQVETYNLGWLSPRAGIEIPLSDKYSINVLGGYLWFNNAQNDFDGWMLEFMLSGRF